MKNKKTLTALVLAISLLALFAAAAGIFMGGGPGPYPYETIRGETIIIYGQGLYRHMSAEVAIQGIAQDYVTLFIAIPVLLVALYVSRRGSLKARYLLAGTLSYFLVTYLFYLVMAMYNQFFLVYAALLGLTFFALALTLFSFDRDSLPQRFQADAPGKPAGIFLIVNAAAIAALWLGVVLPPLLEGSIYPPELEHYTTLIVQGLDLGLLLPLAVVVGVLLLKRKPLGYLLGPVYTIFLSFLMLALTAKLTFMGLKGYPIVPAIFIIPTFALIAMYLSRRLLQGLKV